MVDCPSGLVCVWREEELGRERERRGEDDSSSTFTVVWMRIFGLLTFCLFRYNSCIVSPSLEGFSGKQTVMLGRRESTSSHLSQ